MNMQVHVDDPLAAWKLYHSLLLGLKEAGFDSEKNTVILCIGSDRSTGDSLGPLVGSYLSRLPLPGKKNILGTLAQPVHATNLTTTLNSIYETAFPPFVLAIDACLGLPEKVGCITVSPGPLKPGAGVNKNLPAVGDLHIFGTVNVSGFMEFFVLQSTRLSLVMRMAEQIARGIYLALKNYDSLSSFSLSPAAAFRSLSTVSSRVGSKEA